MSGRNRIQQMWCADVPPASPLLAGERSTAEGGRVRGIGSLDSFEPPHPNPLPCGERERAEFAASARGQIELSCFLRSCFQLSRSGSLQSLRRVKRGRYDALIAGAAAEIARDRYAHLLLGRVRIVAQELGQRDQHPGRAEAALQAVIVAECLLQRIELVGPRRE